MRTEHKDRIIGVCGRTECGFKTHTEKEKKEPSE